MSDRNITALNAGDRKLAALAAAVRALQARAASAGAPEIYSGTASLDFGSALNTIDGSVAVVGQTLIVAASSEVQVWMQPIATADKTVDEQIADPVDLYATDLVDGVGFTIRGQSRQGSIVGIYNIGWAWS